MGDISIPESEVKWLYGINDTYKIKMDDGIGSIYPVAILPPILGKFVKEQDRYTEYINIGPTMGRPDGMDWKIWGWNALPTTSSSKHATWDTTIIAKSERPSIDDLQNKIKSIQSDLIVLSNLLIRYSSE